MTLTNLLPTFETLLTINTAELLFPDTGESELLTTTFNRLLDDCGTVGLGDELAQFAVGFFDLVTELVAHVYGMNVDDFRVRLLTGYASTHTVVECEERWRTITRKHIYMVAFVLIPVAHDSGLTGLEMIRILIDSTTLTAA